MSNNKDVDRQAIFWILVVAVIVLYYLTEELVLSVVIAFVGLCLALGLKKELQSRREARTTRLFLIRKIQDNLLRQDPPTELSLQTALILGVDSTPEVFGGYCVNLRDKSLECYLIKTKDSPWPLKNKKDPREFEMKNLMFALATWSTKIKDHKSFQIYTDNDAINFSLGSGGDAKKLLNHFKRCEGAKLIDDDVFINSRVDLEKFAKYIQPADDFSRWKINEGIDFLCGLYLIEREKVISTMNESNPDSDYWYDDGARDYDRTLAYNTRIEKARLFLRDLKCKKCGINLAHLEQTNARTGIIV